MQIIGGAMYLVSWTGTLVQTTSRTYLLCVINDQFADDSLTIIDWLRQYAPKEESDNTFLRGFLGKMLFSGEDVTRKVNVLSGGEKVRGMLSKMMLSRANVLLLDDPTNHLDLESITALNDSLIDFKGAIIFTSHDHEFIQTIANHIVEVSAKGVVDRGDTTYDEYLNHEATQGRVQDLY